MSKPKEHLLGTYNPATALRLLGLEDEHYHGDVFAFVHADQATSLRAAAANRDTYGWVNLAEALHVPGVGWLNVITRDEPELITPEENRHGHDWPWPEDFQPND